MATNCSNYRKYATPDRRQNVSFNEKPTKIYLKVAEKLAPSCCSNKENETSFIQSITRLKIEAPVSLYSRTPSLLAAVLNLIWAHFGEADDD